MKSKPSVQLNPRIKMVWRITDSAGLLLIAAMAFGGCLVLDAIPEASSVLWFTIRLVIALTAIGLVCTLFIIPIIRYNQWRYEVSPEFLEITKGIIWREHYVVPFIRVQDTDTRQGPLLRLFGLATVTVSTAASEHSIPGLMFDQAEALRDKAAEFARVAKEDV